MSTNTEDLVIGEGDVAKPQELHQRGMAAEAEGDRIAAIEAYREAVAESPLTESRFRLAWLLDLMGEEEEALRSTSRSQQTINPTSMLWSIWPSC